MAHDQRLQARRTKISVPPSASYELDTLDVGGHAHVGLMATDDDGLPATGRRTVRVTHVDGDHTATVHVEPLMWLNVQFRSTAQLAFHVMLYEVK